MLSLIHKYKICTYLFMNGSTFLIKDYSHYRSIYYVLSRYCCKSLECIFYGTNQCLFRSNDILYKISFNKNSDIDNFRCNNFGVVYDVIKLENGHMLYILEFIKNMLSSELIVKNMIIEPFILLYSLTIDYLTALSVLHKNNKIHCNVKPLNLMINNNIGKLVGLDDLVDIVPKDVYYYFTSGSIEYLAPERYKYFKQNGFFGMTSIYSDIWELFYSILCIIDVIDVDEFFYLLYNNDSLLEFYILNRVVKVFHLELSNTIMVLVSKYVNLCILGLSMCPLERNNANYYLEKLIGYRNIVC